MINFCGIGFQSLKVPGALSSSLAVSLDSAALAILAGMLPLLILAKLPSWGELVLLTSGALLLAWVPRPLSRILAILLFSFIWAALHAKVTLQPLRRPLITLDSQVVVRVIGITITQLNHRHLVRLLAVDEHRLPWWHQSIVNVQWPKGSPPRREGQIWRLQFQLRPVHAQLNQGCFDGQRWAIAQRQLFTASARRATLLDATVSWRQKVVDWVRPQMENLPTAAILCALAFGERSRLTTEQRQLLQQTGTAHLMAISGLHISLAALLGWTLSRLLQSIAPIRYLQPLVPLLVSWLCATVYVWLAGANPPALRSWFALSCCFWLRWRGYRWRPGQILLRVAALLLLIDPLTVLSVSFWLSCSAVTALLFWGYWVPFPLCLRHRIWRLLLQGLQLQLGLFLLLMPLQGLFFKGVALFSLPANWLAIPVVSFCTVPALLAALSTAWFPTLASCFWHLADGSLSLLLKGLYRLPHGWLPLPAAAWGLSCAGWLLVIIIRLAFWRTHSVTLLLLSLLMVLPLQRRTRSLWRLDVLDVGHGLAVVISRNGEALLYDVGSAWPNGSVAERVILPHLRWRGLRLQGVIISHDDRDHAGGWPVIQQTYPHIGLRSASQQQPEAQPCQAGEQWRWQGLHFEVLWPPKVVPRAYNRHSCTLRISDNKHQVLLTGDITQQVEWRLARERADQLTALLLLVPHHGSLTSSSLELLTAVKPRAAIVSVARYNPWRLPAQAVQLRYQRLGIRWWSTAQSGQISVQLHDQGWKILTYRQALAPRWYHDYFETPQSDGDIDLKMRQNKNNDLE